MTRNRTFGAIAAGLAGLLLLSACGGGGDPLAGPDAAPAAEGVVRVGSEQFPENQLLGEIYAQALEGADITVERQFAIGSRETYFPGLLDGSIDAMWAALRDVRSYLELASRRGGRELTLDLAYDETAWVLSRAAPWRDARGKCKVVVSPSRPRRGGVGARLPRAARRLALAILASRDEC